LDTCPARILQPGYATSSIEVVPNHSHQAKNQNKNTEMVNSRVLGKPAYFDVLYSFIPNSISHWNCLPLPVVSQCSFREFKHYLHHHLY